MNEIFSDASLVTLVLVKSSESLLSTQAFFSRVKAMPPGHASGCVQSGVLAMACMHATKSRAAAALCGRLNLFMSQVTGPPPARCPRSSRCACGC